MVGSSRAGDTNSHPACACAGSAGDTESNAAAYHTRIARDAEICSTENLTGIAGGTESTPPRNRPGITCTRESESAAIRARPAGTIHPACDNTGTIRARSSSGAHGR